MLITIIIVFIISNIIFNITKTWFQIIQKNKEQEFLKEELTRLKQDEQYLEREIQKLQHPDYVIKIAREQYLYSRDGEFIIKIP